MLAPLQKAVAKNGRGGVRFIVTLSAARGPLQDAVGHSGEELLELSRRLDIASFEDSLA